MRNWLLLVGALGAVALGACEISSSEADLVPPADDAGPGTPPTAPTFVVSGTVAGLVGTSLVLQNNGGDDVAVATNGSFQFATKLKSGDTFNVSIKAQPSAPAQTCTVSGGTGMIASGNVSSVVVNCAMSTFTVGGTVTGLVGSGLTLQNNAGSDVFINANGTFSFSAPVTTGGAYAVTVKTQPTTPWQTCTVANASGNVVGANVTNVAVTCTTNEYEVGGTVTGLSGSGLTLQVNGGQSLPITSDGSFAFPTALASGAAFEVIVSGEPASQTCTIAGGTGTIGGAAVSSVVVNCATNKYSIGGSVAGLVGSGLVLQNNGGDDRSITASGNYAFATPLESGTSYAVTVKSHPTNPWQTCVPPYADTDSGTVGTAPVTKADFHCWTNWYHVEVTVTGLAAGSWGLRLQNFDDDLGVSADGTFEFQRWRASGTTYDVTVSNQPTSPTQTCTVTKGKGTIGGANPVIAVSCTTNAYTVGGTVSGLTGSGLVLRNNGGDDLAINADGPFSFPTPLLSGTPYAVSVQAQPSGQTCAPIVGTDTGIVGGDDLTSVAIKCSSKT